MWDLSSVVRSARIPHKDGSLGTWSLERLWGGNWRLEFYCGLSFFLIEWNGVSVHVSMNCDSNDPPFIVPVSFIHPGCFEIKVKICLLRLRVRAYRWPGDEVNASDYTVLRSCATKERTTHCCSRIEYPSVQKTRRKAWDWCWSDSMKYHRKCHHSCKLSKPKSNGIPSHRLGASKPLLTWRRKIWCPQRDSYVTESRCVLSVRRIKKIIEKIPISVRILGLGSLNSVKSRFIAIQKPHL